MFIFCADNLSVQAKFSVHIYYILLLFVLSMNQNQSNAMQLMHRFCTTLTADCGRGGGDGGGGYPGGRRSRCCRRRGGGTAAVACYY